MRIFNLGCQRRMILQQSPFLIQVNSSMGPTSASVARVISKQREIGRNILKRSIWAKARETTLKPRKGMTFGPAVCCNKVCNDKRAVWKHYRTMHCNLFIHYCPVPGCSTGNDQKDSIVAHIIKEYKNEEEWVDKGL